jgi:hypothetical protein
LFEDFVKTGYRTKPGGQGDVDDLFFGCHEKALGMTDAKLVEVFQQSYAALPPEQPHGILGMQKRPPAELFHGAAIGSTLAEYAE